MAGPYEARKITAAIERVKRPVNFLWNILIGKEIEEVVQEIEIHSKDNGRVRAAFVGPMSNGILIEREGFAVERYKPPFISLKIPATAESAYQQQFGEGIYVTGKKDLNKILKKQVAEDLKTLKTIAHRTKIWALSQLVMTGVFPMGDGKEGIRYGNFALKVLTGTDKFDNVDSDIIGWLSNQKLEIQKNTGNVVDTVIVTPDVARSIINNKVLMEKVRILNDTLIDLKPKEKEPGVSYIGYIPEIDTKIYSYMDWVKEYGKPNEEPILPDGTLLYFKAKSFRVNYGSFPFREKITDKAKIFIGKEAVKTVPSSEGNTDLLELKSSPLIIPEDAQGWIAAKVI
ncbi:MAG TPA: phage capsid protein [Fusobacteriaceae bacterium]|nr:phage capsid protein [Fusobacteriaceae bacterium]